MQPQRDPRSHRETLEPTEARQASPRKMNFRVLLASMALAVVVGVVLVANFWKTTPTAMDYSSGGKLGEQGATPSAQPSPGGAPEAAPSPSTTPGPQNPSNP
jgi:uncharacterized membrane protein